MSKNVIIRCNILISDKLKITFSNNGQGLHGKSTLLCPQTWAAFASVKDGTNQYTGLANAEDM